MRSNISARPGNSPTPGSFPKRTTSTPASIHLDELDAEQGVLVGR
jgi:hypothetical protein